MKATLLLFFTLLSTAALAQRRHPIDVAYQKCVAKDAATGDGAPGGLRACDGEALRQWNAEMARLLAKLPIQRTAQVAWVRQRDKHITEMKSGGPGGEVPMGVLDEVRGYQIEATRLRVLELTKLAKEQAFVIPKE